MSSQEKKSDETEIDGSSTGGLLFLDLDKISKEANQTQKSKDEERLGEYFKKVGYTSSGVKEEFEKIIDLRTKKVEKNLEKLQKQFEEKLKNSEKDLDDKIENSKLSVIETLGVFVALFTFISIDFQVFRSYRDPYAITGLTLILLGSVSFLISVLDFFILKARSIKNSVDDTEVGDSSWLESINRSLKSNKSRIFILSLEVLFIIGGIFLLSKSKIEEFSDSKDQIKKEIFEYTKSSLQKDIDLLVGERVRNGENGELKTLKGCVRDFGFTYKCFK